MKIHALPLVVLFLGFACSDSVAQVVETSNGKVEFIGLEKWTPRMIQEKLRYESPDNFHFCAADLRDKLKFADASVVVDRENGRRYTVVTVVEPDRASDVRYKSKPKMSVPVPDEWHDLIQLVEEKRVLNGLLRYGSTLRNAIRTSDESSPDEDTAWWKLVQGRRSRSDYELALKTLSGDKDFQKRLAAAVILTNFADHDATWLALMEGLRDEDQFVNGACTQALITLTKYVPRKVDWSSAALSIRYVLNGTNLFALPHVLETLLQTNVSRRLARPLLKDNGGRMLLPYLRAKHQRERTLSQKLLVRLSGKDFGFDEARWATWIARVK